MVSRTIRPWVWCIDSLVVSVHISSEAWIWSAALFGNWVVIGWWCTTLALMESCWFDRHHYVVLESNSKEINYYWLRLVVFHRYYKSWFVACLWDDLASTIFQDLIYYCCHMVRTWSLLFLAFLQENHIFIFNLTDSADGGNFAKLFVGSVPRTVTEDDVSLPTNIIYVPNKSLRYSSFHVKVDNEDR